MTVIARNVDGLRALWRPFGPEGSAGVSRSIAKSVLGDRLVFEEHHHAWGLRFRATWAPSARYGWVRTVELADLGGQGSEVEVLDGLLDVMPAGVTTQLEQTGSNLVDAYKRSETGPWASLAVYTLESLITDRAEPAESLTATVVWSSGFTGGGPDLDGRGVAAMIDGRSPPACRLLTGRPGAYLLRGPLTVPVAGSVTWLIAADTALSHPEVLEAVHAAADSGATGSRRR